jgi:surface antigen
MKKIVLLLAAVGMLLTACENVKTAGEKERIAAVGGAVLGGFLGSQVGGGSGQLWATGAGAIIGGLMGSSAGRSLDRADQLMMERTTQAALEHTRTGTTSTWNNPDTGHQGTVTPAKTFQKSSGEYCREYTQTITVGGKKQDAYGTACRQPDGSWRISN